MTKRTGSQAIAMRHVINGIVTGCGIPYRNLPYQAMRQLQMHAVGDIAIQINPSLIDTIKCGTCRAIAMRYRDAEVASKAEHHSALNR